MDIYLPNKQSDVGIADVRLEQYLVQNGNACLSVTIPEDDEEEYVGRPLTEDEIEAICRNYENCDDCPLYNYCDEEMM